MAIQDDFTVDTVLRRITYTTAFTDDRPPQIYTVNELYSFLQDLFDEPRFMQYTVPMSAQTPTQYTLINGWFMDAESMKALYGGSVQTSAWTYVASPAAGITAMRWSGGADTPIAGDIGVTVTGGTSTATGDILAVDTARSVVWVRNTNGSQFSGNETVTGTGVSFSTETNNGVLNGESIWANLFSVGSKAVTTEIYVGQEDDQMGGTAFHQAAAIDRLARRREKVAEWWDTDVDFSASPNLIGGAGHFDVLVLTQENGTQIDGQRLGAFAREFGRVYSSFEFTGGVGNFVVPFASTGADLNAADGPYEASFNNRTGTTMAIGDVLENDTGTTPVGRLRAVVTSVTGGASATGSIEYYLIGENEADGTLNQFANLDNVRTRGASTNAFDINGAPTQVTNGPAEAGGITITFADASADVDEDLTNEDYACTINCNNLPLSRVYKHVQFLASRGNQDGTVAGTPDTLLHSGQATDEGGEFYRAIGDVYLNYDTGTGTQPTEGDIVDGSLSGATGVVTSITAGTTGVMVLTQVKGTFQDGDVIAEINAAGGNSVTADGAPGVIVKNTAAPFGTYAGGRWFVAQGVLLTNVPAADANNWETSDITASRKAPPTQRAITFGGGVTDDRLSLFEVTVASGRTIDKTHNSIAAGGESAGSSVIDLDANVANDRPTSGFIRVDDVSSSTGEEYRLEYSSYSAAAVTLRTTPTGSATSLGSSTLLNDTGAFTSFGADGDLKVGHIIRNTTDGSWARVVRKVTNDQIETTALQGGTDDTWEASDAWDSNVVPVALVDADQVYFPYVDGVLIAADSGELSSTVKFIGNRNLIARARFSSPDISASRIEPFEQTGITFTDADLTVTAIRTTDSIAA
jgi:hypothetical protein